jgi:membrane associated rhomboid family serine protease
MTLGIIIITTLISLLAFRQHKLFQDLAFHPSAIRYSGQGYRFFSYALIHADFMHLLVNMFVLWSFGRIVESYYIVLFPGKGMFFYFLLYLGGIIFSTLPSYGKHKDNPGYSAVGASGAVSAVLFSSIIFQPLGSIVFIFLPFPIPAFVFGILYLVYSAYMARKGHDNIGHDAHFWGAVFGLVFTLVLRPELGKEFFRSLGLL